MSVRWAWRSCPEVDRRAAEAGPARAQEREALALAVGRLVALKPDVVLVERTVAQAARDAFRAAGVAVALNVKRSLLEALARVTGAEVRRAGAAWGRGLRDTPLPELAFCALRGGSE
jgi:predicted Fe-Mo cluster-binding NifX family protein